MAFSFQMSFLEKFRKAAEIATSPVPSVMNAECSTQDFSKINIFKFLKTYPYTYTPHTGLVYCPRNLDAESSLDVSFSVVKS